MKTLVILGAGQFGRAAANLINEGNVDLLAFADNSEKLQGKAMMVGGRKVSVLAVRDALALKPDLVLIGVTDKERGGQLTEQARREGFDGKFLLLKDLYEQLDIRSATLFRVAERLRQLYPELVGMKSGGEDTLPGTMSDGTGACAGAKHSGAAALPGAKHSGAAALPGAKHSGEAALLDAERAASPLCPAMAELGVYQGETARKLNALFPALPLYLFDTFQGFDHRDLELEHSKQYSHPRDGEFADTSEAAVLGSLPFPEKAIIRKGYFPDTAAGLTEHKYLLVSLDADLYAPTLAGLRYFYPRLMRSGIILLHDYNNLRFFGVRQALADFEAECGPVSLIPLCDLHGTALIVHP